MVHREQGEGEEGTAGLPVKKGWWSEWPEAVQRQLLELLVAEAGEIRGGGPPRPPSSSTWADIPAHPLPPARAPSASASLLVHGDSQFQRRPSWWLMWVDNSHRLAAAKALDSGALKSTLSVPFSSAPGSATRTVREISVPQCELVRMCQ